MLPVLTNTGSLKFNVTEEFNATPMVSSIGVLLVMAVGTVVKFQSEELVMPAKPEPEAFWKAVAAISI